MLRKNFITGLTILLPIVVTFWLVIFIINFFTGPFRGLAQEFLQHSGFDYGEQTITVLAKGLTIVAFLFLTLTFGLIIRAFAISSLVNRAEKIFDYIPIVGKIYHAAKEVVHTLIGEEKDSFAQVVLVPFPHQETLSIGLLSRDAEIIDPTNGGTLISVFIPAAPNPTMGFMLLFPKEKVIYSPMPVEEALKAVISCGAMIGQEPDQ